MNKTTTQHRRFIDLSEDDQDAYIAESERMLDELDPAGIATADRLDDLRAIRAVLDSQALLGQQLETLVLTARSNGRSWADIARVLGVTRQSAHAKYRTAAEVRGVRD